MHIHAMNIRTARAQAIMACLGDPSRFRMVEELAGGECYVLELSSRVGLSQSCTTRHLQVLAREGIVERERKGKRVMFRLRVDDPAVMELVDWARRASAPERRGRKSPPRSTRSSRPGAAPAPPPEAPDSEPPPLEPTASIEESSTDPPPRPYDDLEDFLL
jgi:DNA-binding transcriptional ArsR family regulator